MELVQSGAAAVVGELSLDLQLILRDVLPAHRAGRNGPRSAPGMVRWSGWQFSSADHFSGLRAQNSLVGHGRNSRSGGVVMPDARRPGRLLASPSEPDGRQSVVYILKRIGGYEVMAWSKLEKTRRPGAAPNYKIPPGNPQQRSLRALSEEGLG